MLLQEVKNNAQNHQKDHTDHPPQKKDLPYHEVKTAVLQREVSEEIYEEVS
jgi:hypothetical protein